MGNRRIGIIGAGPGGICMAVRLQQSGYTDIRIWEREPGVGGTWRHNSYPGCAVDIVSHVYSFSFHPKPDWRRPYDTQPELLAYMEGTVKAFGLEPYLRLSTGIAGARWDDAEGVWHVRTEAGDEETVDVLISALGMFNNIVWPDIKGWGSFEGTTFHSARWDHQHDLTGERVAVIGSAASAVQFIPEIAKVVGQVHVFQRTANWVVPKLDTPFTEEELEELRADPSKVQELRAALFTQIDTGLAAFGQNQEAVRVGLEANMAVIEDPELRRKLTPTHPFGCKRPLLSNDWFPTFNRPNVELVTERITEITPTGVVTDDGRLREVDTIIAATGFDTLRYLAAIDVTGRDGQHISEAWADGAQAYLGITTSGFPNLFMLYGPNTNNGSILHMIECQVDYTVRQLQRMDADDLAWIDVRPEAMHEYNERLQADLDQVEVWNVGACTDYYRTPSGRIVTQWPHNMGTYREWTEVADADAYESASRA